MRFSSMPAWFRVAFVVVLCSFSSSCILVRTHPAPQPPPDTAPAPPDTTPPPVTTPPGGVGSAPPVGSSGPETPYTNWKPGHPADAPPDAHCATLAADNIYWQADECTVQRWFACRNTELPFDWKVTNARGPWNQGQAACIQEFGDTFAFAVPSDAEDNWHAVEASDGVFTWINYTDLAKPGTWNVLPYFYANWAPGQPDVSAGVNCVEADANGQWSLRTCETEHPYACQSQEDPLTWKLTATSGPWAQGEARCAAEFGAGFVFGSPVSATEAQALTAASAGAQALWLDLTGRQDQPGNVVRRCLWDGCFFEVTAVVFAVNLLTTVALAHQLPSNTSDSVEGPTYRRVSMNPRYKGEEQPGNNIWGMPVQYLHSAAERQAYRLTVSDGLLYNDGKLFDTSPPKSAIFVMSPTGEIYASRTPKVGFFHHSSFLAGGPVAAAGELRVSKGVLEMVNNFSGHYRPPADVTYQVFTQFERNGLSTRHVDWIYR